MQLNGVQYRVYIRLPRRRTGHAQWLPDTSLAMKCIAKQMTTAPSVAWMEGGPHFPASIEWRVVRANGNLSSGKVHRVVFNGAWVICDGVILHLDNSEPLVASRRILNERPPSPSYAPA